MTFARPNHIRQQGGVTLLVVFIILVVMTVAAASVADQTLRELAITGNESTGRKAAEAADAGLDWLIAYGNPDAGKEIKTVKDIDPLTGLPTGTTTTSVVNVSQTGANQALQDQVAMLLDATGSSDPNVRVAKTDPKPSDGKTTNPVSDYGTMSDVSGSLRIFMRGIDYPGSAMWLAGPGSTGFAQNTSVVTQSFDTEIRYLGMSFKDRFKPVGTKKNGALFLIRSLGRANVGGTGQSFIARREVLMEYTP